MGLTKQLAGAKALADVVKRDFAKDDIDIAWCGDISYIRTWKGWLYLAMASTSAHDALSAFSIADHVRTELVEDALAMAVKTHGRSKMPNVEKAGRYSNRWDLEERVDNVLEVAEFGD